MSTRTSLACSAVILLHSWTLSSATLRSAATRRDFSFLRSAMATCELTVALQHGPAAATSNPASPLPRTSTSSLENRDTAIWNPEAVVLGLSANIDINNGDHGTHTVIACTRLVRDIVRVATSASALSRAAFSVSSSAATTCTTAWSRCKHRHRACSCCIASKPANHRQMTDSVSPGQADLKRMMHSLHTTATHKWKTMQRQAGSAAPRRAPASERSCCPGAPRPCAHPPRVLESVSQCLTDASARHAITKTCHLNLLIGEFSQCTALHTCNTRCRRRVHFAANSTPWQRRKRTIHVCTGMQLNIRKKRSR